MSMDIIINELHLIFNNFNKAIFHNQLNATITVQTKGKKPYPSWCTNIPVWISDNGKQYEINITAEYLKRSYLDIAENMLHEMIHLEASRLNIQDTSRQGRYHNRKYKELAEANGLNVSKDEKIGYAITSLKPDTEHLIRSWNRPEIFKMHRIDTEASRTKKKKPSYKNVCPMCEIAARSTKDINLMCLDCKSVMIKEILNSEDDDNA